MINRIGFRSKAEDTREDYAAMITFFSQNLLDELSLMPIKEGEKVVEQLREVLYGAIEE